MPKRVKSTQEAIASVRQQTGDPVEFAVLTEDGRILFAVPLPPKYGNLPYPRIEGGRIIMPELEFELWEDAWSDYKKDALIKAARRASTKRTRKQAKEAGVVVDLSPKLALSSCKSREGILSTNPNPMGYLLPVKPEFAAALRAENEIDEARLEEIRDETSELDRPLLYVLYTLHDP